MKAKQTWAQRLKADNAKLTAALDRALAALREIPQGRLLKAREYPHSDGASQIAYVTACEEVSLRNAEAVSEALALAPSHEKA